MTREIFTAADGKQLSLAVWECKKAKGVIQIAHGMAEHIERYDAFAQYLNENGYTVVGDDHRAHGETDPNALGLIGEGDLFEKSVSDEIEITKMLKERYGLPVILFGHSYGSFLAQRYISLTTENLAAAVLCGSALMKGVTLGVGYLMAKGRLDKANEPGKIFAAMTFEGYDEKFKEGKNAWLSRDKAEVDKYNADPKCGFTCSNGFYFYFFRGLRNIAKDKHETLDKNFKLLVTSGANDPVGGYGKLTSKLHARYVKLGLTATLKLYEGARHEILNEFDRDVVYADLLAYFNGVIG